MKTQNKYFLIAGFFLVCAIWLVSIGYDYTPKHECRWELCPYKGVKPSGYKVAVKAYVGEEGTDGYCIDLLHLEHPNYEYEELENLLFKGTKQ